MIPTRFRVDVLEVFQHPISGRVHVVVFQAAVIDELPEILTVAAAAAVFRCNYGVSLAEQFPEDIEVAAVEIAVDSAVNEDD